MNVNEKFELIKRNTQEIVTEKELMELLKNKKQPSVYLGTAITGKPHIAYFIWVLKLADFLKAGFKVKLLLADLHGALDNCPWDLLEKRYKYYSEVVSLMFKSVGADIKNFEIITGSSFQLKKDYMLDVLKYSTFVSINDCKRASADVVKYGKNPQLSGLIYPIMQSLDEVYLNIDIQYGGTDQRKILMFSRENLPRLGYKPRIEIMNPMLPGLVGKKMSASDDRTKIDLLDDEKTVKIKINKAFCPEGIIEDNGVLSFAEHVIMTILQDQNKKFIINRPEKWGGNLEFKTKEELEKSFVKKEIHPMDLKNAVVIEINKLLEPMRKNRVKLEKLAKEAYPDD